MFVAVCDSGLWECDREVREDALVMVVVVVVVVVVQQSFVYQRSTA